MKLLNYVKIIFKGDQNICWDGLITDLALFNKLLKENSSYLFLPFIHDEKLGAPDQNIAYCRGEKEEYFITEDYSDSAGDACYINIDCSYGLFYLPALELKRLKEFKINVKSLSKKYLIFSDRLDETFIKSIKKFGFMLNLKEDFEYDDFGPLSNKDELNCLFNIHPEQKLFYLFTKSWGRFGVVPAYDNNFLFSSIELNSLNLDNTLKSLFFDYLVKGLIEQSYERNDKNKILVRSKNLYKYIKDNLKLNSTISDLESLIFTYISKDIGFDYNINLLRSSLIFMSPVKYGLKHYFLNLSKNYTEKFVNAYNDALNKTRINMQRIRLNNNFYNIPFYVNINNDGKIDRNQLLLDNTRKVFLYRNSLINKNIDVENINSKFITGKAIPFLSELSIYPNAVALPEQGSKYTPAVDYFINNLRNFINVPNSRIIRIGLNFLDNLEFNGDYILNLPKIFHPFFGNSIKCIDLSLTWRRIVEDIYSILGSLNEFDEGQYVKEALFIIKKNMFIEPDFLNLLKDLIFSLNELKENIKIKRHNTKDEERLRLKTLDFEIELAVNLYKQRLLDVADGLLYLNDRPYSIAIYLMFGANFVNYLINNVTLRAEIK